MAKILVVDDDRIIRAILRDMLSGAGYDVVQAADGDKALELYETDPADLVITDLFLPPSGGLALITQLKEADPKAKIIAISGVALTDTEVRYETNPGQLALERGALRSFRKPFSKEEMLGAISELLEA
ncbi:MAG: response regulator [Candidatus Latescibacteria bacterium]|nr:response regulator [Candidatus Latescibacterota bacterium]